MIRKSELEAVRAVNRKLPFADPIEPGLTFAEWAEKSLSVNLLPFQIAMGEAIMRGDIVIGGRRIGKQFTRAVVQHYIEAGTDG